FCLLIGHPDLIGSAEDLVRTYRAKHTVEADFRTIKSCVELRPVRHQTDAKVRAHVTLCMLALLLHRTLERRLRPLHMSPEVALTKLQSCPLNLLEHGFYTVTRPDAEQTRILETLGLESLVDDDELRATMTPRHVL